MPTDPSGTPAEVQEANENLARILTRALRALGDAGDPQEAGRLGGQAWSAIRAVHPHAAQRINGMMHYLAKLEGEGGVGSADLSDGPVTRIARVIAREGSAADLLRAARANTQDALAAGALTAEVYEDSETTGGLAVVSRWAKQSELEEFLSWHEEQAHESMAEYSLGKPRATHYPLAR